MGEIFANMGEIIAAFADGDSWMIREALAGPGAWALGLILMLLGGYLIMLIYRFVPFIERHLESYVMVISYLTIGGIIFFGVIQRFVPGMLGMDFSNTPQWLRPWPWTTSLPPFLFLVMTWVGCSYNVKLRTHLSFNEFRTNMPRTPQMALLTLDAILWIGFSWVVVVTGSKVVANAASNFQIVPATDGLMQWWFILAVPLSFVFLVARVMENWAEDFRRYRTGEQIIEQAVIGGDT
ncbi:C4-dicarboxylate ABC transporter [Jannaschia sp. EhC01]|uniref:TRAP transporter small permease protein n=1 Tax=Gymnodinialimonas phycosphaerae TaxID=2841589 RepID=A0A975YEB3_9RHOB|nr:TRAP transporter small permease [Gymnodinialimonas phycosphaerae]MBY4893460.1 TRAP transporter small permease subunit [Gymnodinialimonas phycosphaerae]OAN76257.1 C4-dicarboxylate ABC transporter [Jannaschia sp. EhC01]